MSPDPRGVGASGGGPHDTATALADLETIRTTLSLDQLIVLGHSYGADLALAYAVHYPASLVKVVAVCGTGVQNDRGWKARYDALKHIEPRLDIAYDEAVHRALLDDWRRWITSPSLLAELSRLAVHVKFVLAENDIRPSWPAEQLAQLLPAADLEVIGAVGHSFWHTHPARWRQLVETATSAS